MYILNKLFEFIIYNLSIESENIYTDQNNL